MTDTLTVDEQLVELDAAAEYMTEEFSPAIGAGDDDVSRETSEINTAPAPRKKPGPAPNPNSARSRRRAAKAVKAAAPRKRATPNGSSTSSSSTAAAEPASVHERGAVAILGWFARPLALAGMGMALTAGTLPTLADGRPSKRALQLDRHGQALSLDSAAIVVHGPELAKGLAPLAESIPWMAGVLEKAAKVSPAAAALEASAGLMMQILANHGLVPVAAMLGTLGPAELLAAAGLEYPEPDAG